MVQHFLSSMFGGTYLHYPSFKYFQDSYLIKLPQGVDKRQVIHSGTLWGREADWVFQDWDVEEEASYQPKHFRVRVRISNFPLEFWHSTFIRQVVSEFGEVTHIDEENILGSDRTNLHLWFKCIDPRRIPTSKLLPYENYWKECFIKIITWHYTDWVPEESHYSALDQRNLYAEVGNHHDMPRLTLLAAHDKLQNFWSHVGSMSPTRSHDTETRPSHMAHSAPGRMTMQPPGSPAPTTISTGPKNQWTPPYPTTEDPKDGKGKWTTFAKK